MQCTRCSEVVHPVVALDIDGTLGDYHGHLLRFALSYLGMEYVGACNRAWTFDGTQQFGSWFCEAFGVDLTTFRQIKLAYRQGGMKRSMPVYEGATELFEMLERQHAEVWLCTTRPYLRLDNIDPDTRFWLARHGAVYHGMLYDEDKYEQLYKRIYPERVVAVLDDLPEQVAAASECFGSHVPILMRNYYNLGVGARISVAGLDEARQIIEQRILRWRSENA